MDIWKYVNIRKYGNMVKQKYGNMEIMKYGNMDV